MKSAIEFVTVDTQVHEGYVTECDIEMPYMLPTDETQDELGCVSIYLTKPVNLNSVTSNVSR